MEHRSKKTLAARSLLAALLLALLAGPPSGAGQSQAEVARESKRKKAHSTRPVWTNDELGSYFPEIKQLPEKTALGSLSTYQGTPMPIVRAMLEGAQVGREDLVFDLGSGDGRIVIMAAEEFGARAVGIELAPALVAASREAVAAKRLEERVLILEANFFDVDVSPATVVTLFLTRTALAALRPHLEKYLRPGTRVVAYAFPVPHWRAERTEPANGSWLYFYKIPDLPGNRKAESR